MPKSMFRRLLTWLFRRKRPPSVRQADATDWRYQETSTGTVEPRRMKIMEGDREVCQTTVSIVPYSYDAICVVREEFGLIIKQHNNF